MSDAPDQSREGLSPEMLARAAAGSILEQRCLRDRATFMGSQQTDRTQAVSMFSAAEAFAWLASLNVSATADDHAMLGVMLLRRGSFMSSTDEIKDIEHAKALTWLNAAADDGHDGASTAMANIRDWDVSPAAFELAGVAQRSVKG